MTVSRRTQERCLNAAATLVASQPLRTSDLQAAAAQTANVAATLATQLHSALVKANLLARESTR